MARSLAPAVVSLFLGSTLGAGALGCSAPAAEAACSDYCDQLIFTCGSPQSEAECMWTCLAGMEWRKQKGRRCHKMHRREVACLANVNDCEFLLEEDSYRRGDPCAERGTARSNACEERGVPADELVPLGADLAAAESALESYDGAHLDDAHLDDAHLDDALLDDALLDDAHLDDAHIDDAHPWNLREGARLPRGDRY